MIGKIYINGQIGANEGEVGVNLINVIKQVKGQPFATSFEVFINSEGGYVDVGFDIYDYLKSLKVPITTIGVGLVASIATVIFMAGDTRKFRNGTRFMIHLPSGMIEGTAEEITNYSQMLKDAENKIIKFYTSSLALTDEAIRPLLKNETWLSNDDAFDMGFITEMEMEYPAVAKFNNLNLDTKMTNEDKTWIEQQFANFTALFSKPKNIVLQDSNGVSVDFPNVEDGQSPAVGDEAIIDGQPAEGSFIMPQLDNITIVVVGGKVTEVIEVVVEDEEMTALKQENEQLKEQLATATAEVTANATKLTTIETEFTNFKAQIVAKFETTPTPQPTPNANTVTNTAQTRLETLKTNKNKK